MASILSILRNTDVTATITVKVDGVVIDITGQTLLFTVKKVRGGSSDDSDAVISKTITSHSDPVNGLSELVLSETDTDIVAGRYVYDFKRVDGSTIVGYDHGTLIVEDTVTQRSS